jgi:hypothetical protein
MRNFFGPKCTRNYKKKISKLQKSRLRNSPRTLFAKLWPEWRLTKVLIPLCILRSICFCNLSQWKLDEWCIIIFWIWDYNYGRNVTSCKSHYDRWRSNLVLHRHVPYSYNPACVRAYIYITRRNPTLEEEMKKVENNKEEKAENKE